MNTLSGDTYVFAEIDGQYGVYNLRELFEIHGKGHRIKVPTLLNERGEKTWVEVEDVMSFGEQSLERITLSRSRLYVEATEDTIIPAYSDNLFSGREKQIILKFKRANELKVTELIGNNNTLLLTTHIPLHILEGDQKEWDIGFALGFWLAEGSIERRKHKKTKQSLAILKGFAKRKGMTLEEYLEHMTDVRLVKLAVGQADFERGYVDIVQKHFKFSKPHKVTENGYVIYSFDLSLIHLIKEYTEGETSHNKCVKNEIYNRSWKFLEGILDGFLSGDGSFVKKLDEFQVGITTNYKLRDDLVFIAKALGYDIHLKNERFVKSPFPSYEKVYHLLHLSIFKNWHRRSALGLVKEHIKKIEDVGLKEAFNLVLKPIYSENDKRAKFNHLFISAFGFLVSDAVKTLDRSVLSSSLPAPLSS